MKDNIQLFQNFSSKLYGKMKNRPTYSQLYPHLSEGKEAFLTVQAAKRLLLCAVGSLVLAELIRRGEALFTLVASEDYVSLQNERDI